jgi:hypothetical protein
MFLLISPECQLKKSFKGGPAPGAKFEIGATQLLMAVIADQGHFFGAIGAVGEAFEEVALFRGQAGYFFSAVRFLANLVHATGQGLAHLLSLQVPECFQG